MPGFVFAPEGFQSLEESRLFHGYVHKLAPIVRRQDLTQPLGSYVHDLAVERSGWGKLIIENLTQSFPKILVRSGAQYVSYPSGVLSPRG
jgi:hypothetical protein